MSSSFNEKFNFKYDKDVLKNRHKTLSNLYKAVKHLLDQMGFNWDEKRKMVTTDNDVWNEYIKHPVWTPHPTTEEKGYLGDNYPEMPSNLGEDASMITTRPKNSSEGVCEFLHDIMVDEDYVVATPEKAVTDSRYTLTKVSGTTLGSWTRTNWQPPTDLYFIDLMVDHVQQGNKGTGLMVYSANNHGWR
ncbi:L10-interacting MYB domain-containing protein [Quillaja saponaria]|uniref:L10-interacting MYB domain-containing protein n=1 Tax=Quillaja saponaria TaxID=32244 RepID=A0AAD7VJ23_QUISA|nr:L10-interacting MYB domain-containing protein [Quillaja saponaria]